VERQNVTISLPKSLLKKAKSIAAQREKSLSQFIRDSLEERIRESTGYSKAKNRQVKLLRRGLNMGTKGGLKISREALHAR